MADSNEIWPMDCSMYDDVNGHSGISANYTAKSPENQLKP